MSCMHCSAGIGRTGAFIAIDVIMKRLREMSEGEAAVSEEDVRQAVDVPAGEANVGFGGLKVRSRRHAWGRSNTPLCGDLGCV